MNTLTIFIALCLLVGVILLFVASVERFIEGQGLVGALLLVTALFASAWLLSKSIELERNVPCAEYEARMTYNAATKTMMPMRVCILRGEWVEEQP